MTRLSAAEFEFSPELMRALQEPVTFGVQFIGSKRKILKYIGLATVGLNVRSVIDVFSGTTRVAQHLRSIGKKVTTSNLSQATSCYAHTYVHNGDNGRLQPIIDELNGLRPRRGWITQNCGGRYFSLVNAEKADAAREFIETLSGLEPWEKDTLVTSVIIALDKVDNTVGVQQSHLKKLCKRARRNIVFELPVCFTGPIGKHYEGDCLTIDYEEHDLAYLDPPYSPHSYASYYHIWDSLALWDKPETGLTTKRRFDRIVANPEYDREMRSPWNSRDTASEAFRELIQRLPTRYVLISYNDESLIAKEKLLNLCKKFGEVRCTTFEYPRHKMARIGNARRNGREPASVQIVEEMLILIDRKR